MSYVIGTIGLAALAFWRPSILLLFPLLLGVALIEQYAPPIPIIVQLQQSIAAQMIFSAVVFLLLGINVMRWMATIVPANDQGNNQQ